MTIHGPSFRTVLLSTTAFCLLFFSAPRSFGAEEARPIASLTPEERSTGLPDSTMVTLKSGRTATLGVLRAERRARLERFAKAAELGKMVAAKLAAQPASQVAMKGPAAKAPAPTPPKPSAGVNPNAVTGATSVEIPKLDAASKEAAAEKIPTPAQKGAGSTSVGPVPAP